MEKNPVQHRMIKFQTKECLLGSKWKKNWLTYITQKIEIKTHFKLNVLQRSVKCSDIICHKHKIPCGTEKWNWEYWGVGNQSATKLTNWRLFDLRNTSVFLLSLFFQNYTFKTCTKSVFVNSLLRFFCASHAFALLLSFTNVHARLMWKRPTDPTVSRKIVLAHKRRFSLQNEHRKQNDKLLCTLNWNNRNIDRWTFDIMLKTIWHFVWFPQKTTTKR